METVSRNSVLAFFVIFALMTSDAAAQRRQRAFRVMTIVDGQSQQFQETVDRFQQELVELMGEDTRVVFVEPPTPTDWTLGSVERALDQALKDRSLSLIVGFGPMAGVAVGRRESLAVPVLLPYAAPVFQGLPRDGDRSGRRNLVYITGLVNFERDFRKLDEIVHFDRLAFIIGAEVLQHLRDPQRPVIEASQELGVETRLVIADGGPQEALDAIPEDSNAVYIGLLPRFSDEQMQLLIDGINAQDLPSYADDVEWVKRGALATTETEADEIRRLRRAALYAQRIYLGEQASELSVTFQPRPQLVINMATARAIGTWPKFSVMAEARLINDESGRRGPVLRLSDVMNTAVRVNLDLMADRIGVDVGEENIAQARGQWLPAADASGEYRWIDRDIANPFGQAERQFNWSLRGSQLLYSAQAHGNLRAQKDQQNAVVDDYYAARLDIMLEAGEAYLNVLRANNNERVNRDNLRLTRRNLALAETRFEIGVAGREEVIRWEITIAESRASLIEANAVRNQSEIDLNRVLNRPLEGPFQLPPEDQIRDVLPGGDPRLTRYIEDPFSFKILREFMAEEGVRNSPEIQAIDETISAQREVLMAERRTLGIPDVFVDGGFQHIPHVAGAGAEPPPDSGDVVFPVRDTFSWDVGVGATFTIFDGTQNYSRIRQAMKQIDQLETDRAALAQRIEQNVRASLHQAGFSFANIQLSQDAAEAAAKNLELVTDSYQRGAVDIIRLIDAQNQAITSKLAAANARYDFLIDALRVERAAGSFSLEGTPQEREDFLRRLDAFAAKRRRPLPEPQPAPEEVQP